MSNGSDPEVCDHVRALLRADQEAPSAFLGENAMQLAARHIVKETAAEGTMVGTYRLGTKVGAGGMGTVYEAFDLRLQRKVALKLLPGAFLQEPERIQRFEREWRAISLLNHPNIVSLYDADLAAGHHYIATEFVEGKTLRALGLERRLENRELVDIAVQICSALVAAHGAGVLHRDIKPENIMVRPDGIVKVLDFGLAKLSEPSEEAAESLLTRPGDRAGTVQYLSPEQVLGRPARAASDLYSLGVVLYELATGVRPSAGPTEGAIFDAILHRVPDPPRQHNPAIDGEMEQILMRLLEKDPDLRFQTAADLRASLRRVGRIQEEVPIVKPGRPSRSSLWVAIGGLAILAAALISVNPWRQAQQPLPMRFERLTDAAGEELYPQLTTDGTQFLFASARDGQWDIFLQRAGGATAINLTNDEADDTQPALSPDGKFIAFRSERGGGGLFVMEATGENPRRIAAQGYLPAWSPDGRSIVYSTETFTLPSIRGGPTSRLVIVDVATGKDRRLVTGDAIQPKWSPHGHRIAYWGLAAGGQRNIYTVRADGTGGSAVALMTDVAVDWNPVWGVKGDELYFLSDRGGTMNVWRIGVDEQTGEARGSVSPMTLPAAHVMHFSATEGGSFVYAAGQQETLLYSIGYDEQNVKTSGEITAASAGINSRNIYNFSFSPDGKQLVHDAVGEGQEDIWIVNADGSGRRRLTSDAFIDRMPVWSPNSNEIAFFGDRSGEYDEWMIQSDGSGLRQLTKVHSMQHPVWSPDGQRLLASRNPVSAVFLQPRAAAPATKLETARGLEGTSDLIFWSWPAKGKWIAGEDDGGGDPKIVLYAPITGELQRLPVRGRRPSWLPGGKQFVFARGGECFVYDLASGKEKLLFSVAPNRIYSIDASRPGRLYFTQTSRIADIWLGRMAP
ncbi:MAG: protein kinase [Acidobacteria bacterium]|nr:protein kinase [Acidobacteriota bacterium]